MERSQPPSRGAIGGAANEAGAEYRRGVAAYFVAHGLNGTPVHGLPIVGDDAIVDAVRLETDFPVDDVFVSLRGGKLFVQAKTDLDFGVMLDVADQWIAAVRHPQFNDEKDFLIAVAGSVSGPVLGAAKALHRARKDATSYSKVESDAMTRLRGALSDCGATAAETDRVVARATILQLTVEEPGDSDTTR